MRSAVSVLMAASMLAIVTPSAAEEIGEAQSSRTASAPTSTQSVEQAAARRRLLVYTGYGVAAVGLGLSFVFLSQANSAYDDRREIARQNGSEQATAWKCTGAVECARMSELRQDQETAQTWWAAMVGLAGGGVLVGTLGRV